MRRNHCDLFCRFWESCHVVTVGGIESVVHCVSVFLHVVPVQISLHIAYQDVCLASWGNLEFIV